MPAQRPLPMRLDPNIAPIRSLASRTGVIFGPVLPLPQRILDNSGLQPVETRASRFNGLVAPDARSDSRRLPQSSDPPAE